MLAVLLAGFWFGGASLAADCVEATEPTNEHVARVDNPAPVAADLSAYYCLSLRDAVEEAADGATITLLKDDRVSFTEEAPELVISKSLTIDGGDNEYTIYWLNNHTGDDHDIFISAWSQTVTIKNLKISEFAGNLYWGSRSYPIWTSQGYNGNLTIENVTIDKFNRTAINANGWTVIVIGCTITGDPTVKKEAGNYFQS